MMLATNAKKIVELRKRGYKPDEMIIVSLVGKVDELNHVVYANPKMEYDWKWCKGLEICVFASSAVDWLKTVKAIAPNRASFLAVWDVDRNQGSEFWYLPILSPPSNLQTTFKYGLIPNVWCAIQNKMFSGELCN